MIRNIISIILLVFLSTNMSFSVEYNNNSDYEGLTFTENGIVVNNSKIQPQLKTDNKSKMHGFVSKTGDVIVNVICFPFALAWGVIEGLADSDSNNNGNNAVTQSTIDIPQTTTPAIQPATYTIVPATDYVPKMHTQYINGQSVHTYTYTPVPTTRMIMH